MKNGEIQILLKVLSSIYYCPIKNIPVAVHLNNCLCLSSLPVRVQKLKPVTQQFNDLDKIYRALQIVVQITRSNLMYNYLRIDAGGKSCVENNTRKVKTQCLTTT